MSYTTETIVIQNPSEKMMNLIDKMREHKLQMRSQMKDVEPVFVIKAES